jgi:hypothetical protein
MESYGIHTSALLVELNVPVWTARKLDRRASDEVVQSNNAGSRAAARVNKNLLAGRTELDKINAHVGSMRNYVYTNTLPWSDTGVRLLPVTRFTVFDENMRKLEDEYWALCKAFVDVYPTLITAQAMALGDLFKREDYPTPEQILHKFGFSLSYMPVPTSGDFRVDVGNDAQATLAGRLQGMVDARVESALADARERLRDYLKHLSDRLTVDVKDDVAKPRIFHDSLLDNGYEMVELAKHLNITNDPAIEQARQSLERTLSRIVPKLRPRSGVELSPADTLREDMEQRSKIKTQVDDLLNSINW